MMFNQNNTRGWALMTPEERTAFQLKMREVKTYEECKVLQAEHRSAMEARAKEKGVTLMAPRAYACDRMQARGWIK
jgi:TRAP-type C4-dicarboxylate transport system substrate-binding protein